MSGVPQLNTQKVAPMKLVPASAHGGKAQSAAALLSGTPAAFAYAPPPAQSLPAAAGAQAGAPNALPIDIVSTHVITVPLISKPGDAPGKVEVQPLKALAALGYDVSKPFHVSDVTVLSTHSTHPGVTKLNFFGLDGVPKSVASSSTAHVDLDGKPVSLTVFPGTNFLQGSHGHVYSKPLSGEFSDTADHAKVDVDKLRQGYKTKPGSSYVDVYPGESPDLARLVQYSASRAPSLHETQTADGVQYYSLTKADVDGLIDTYKTDVQSQFVRTTADKHKITLEHFDAAATNGQVVGAMPGQTRTQKDANSQIDHGVTAVIQYKLVHPDGPRSGSTKK